MGFLSDTVKKVTGGLKKVVKGGAKAAIAPFAASTALTAAGAPLIPSLTGGGGISSALSSLISGNGSGWASGLGAIWDMVSPFLKGLPSSALDAATVKLGYDKQLEGIEKQNASAYRIAQEANAAAKENADAANAMSQANAREQMAFQERMSSTAHQREIQDLAAAGLNPILSGTGGMGSTSPAGASGSVATPDVKTAPVASEGDAVSSAFQAFTALANAFKANADREYVEKVQTPATQASTQKTQAETRNLEATNTKINQETNNLVTMNENLKKQGRLTDAQVSNVKQTTENLKETFKTLRMNGDIDDSEFGRLNEMANRVLSNTEKLPDLSGFLKTLKDVFGKKATGTKETYRETKTGYTHKRENIY